MASINFLGGILDGQALYHVASIVSHFENEFGSTKMSCGTWQGSIGPKIMVPVLMLMVTVVTSRSILHIIAM